MPTAVPTGAHDPPNKIRLVLELYGLFFDELFDDAWTPKHLMHAGLYNEIAMNVAGDEWRAAGLHVHAQ